MSNETKHEFFMMPWPQISTEITPSGEVEINIWEISDGNNPDHHKITLPFDCAKKFAHGLSQMLEHAQAVEPL